MLRITWTRSIARALSPRAAALALILGLFAVAPAPAGAAWQEPTGGPVSADSASFVAPGFAAVGGVPYVAEIESVAGGPNRLHVYRLNPAGTGWEDVAGPVATGFPHDATIADLGGVPYVAFVLHPAGTAEVRRLNAAGTAWEPVAGGTVAGDAISPSIAIVGGVPWVAWHAGGSTALRVSRPNASGTAWEQVGGPLNHDASQNAVNPSITAVGGFPHVAWEEYDGTNVEIRVARLNNAGTGWQEVAPSASPINHASNRDGRDARLAAVDGVPYVTWREFDGHDFEVRVSRRNTFGTAWEEVVGGENPINHIANAPEPWPGSYPGALSPSIVSIDNVPYVAWAENDGRNFETRVARLDAAGESWKEVAGGQSPINAHADVNTQGVTVIAIGGVPYVAWNEDHLRVARLEPEFLDQSTFVGERDALLISRVRTYGVAYPIAFRHGAGNDLGARTDVQRTAYDSHEDTAIEPLSGLTPGTGYSWQPIGFDGFRITGAGPAQGFTTRPEPQPAPSGAAQPQPQSEQSGGLPPAPQPSGAAAPPKLLVAIFQGRLRRVAGHKVTLRYFTTLPAGVRLLVRRNGKTVATKAGRADAGVNRIAWNGRVGRRRAKAGRYGLILRATGSDGQNASDRASLRLRRRR